ncbi:carbohydrate kinase family protein [Pseudomonas typographi]|uniref:Carbohydrate kinase n=1 Tax=Pseudomonas typographi TaxID=2715964 RepID=A0ABR7Z1H7_9PSED|nr:carbohydrate kinase [Pseudomonas typographi]MBD1551743.1 carbohydrate kinase [Pseudomonas typographi]MBD1587002.1 carbohydrate kinase [Pseudomonas typographi]MBD1599242.1 carbohydrate kinase [Pseudomonas typographi]
MYLVCGEALFDFFSEPDTGDLAHVSYQAVAGGSPFNVAIGLARLGTASGLLAGLSTDYLGQRLAGLLEAEGVSERYVQRFDAPTTLAMVALGADGSPQYSFRGEGCADRQITQASLPALGDDVRGLHVGSFSLVVEPIATALAALVAREAERRLISLDPNVRLNPAPSIDTWRARIEPLASQAHVIKVSDEDLHLLYPGQSPASIAERWLGGRCQLVFVTHGGDGAEVFSRTFGRFSETASAVNIADTVGAGDTFQAALLAWLAEQGLDSPNGLQQLQAGQLQQLLQFCVRAAAITCSRTGPDLPRRAEL